MSVPRRSKAVVKAAEAAAPELPEGSVQVLEELSAALCKGKKKKVLTLCQQALEAGVPAQTILSSGLVGGMTKLGEDFTAGRAFVPEMLMAARCMDAATQQLKPLLTGEGQKAAGRVCLGTVRGDMHDIGKNLVKIMMEGCGLEVIDLGVDVAPEQFVQTAKEHKCDIIACSSLLTTCMMEMKQVVALAEAEGIRDQVKILVGGAPITQEFCDEIGADAYTDDAAQCARTAAALLAG
ncbi:MAG: corrinoid protein [Clostridium sp.]|nr:corrinoid protein [Clostridium sp.]